MSQDQVDLSHVLAPTPTGTFECVLCWGCICHRYEALMEPCGKFSRQNGPPKYGRQE